MKFCLCSHWPGDVHLMKEGESDERKISSRCLLFFFCSHSDFLYLFSQACFCYLFSFPAVKKVNNSDVFTYQVRSAVSVLITVRLPDSSRNVQKSEAGTEASKSRSVLSVLATAFPRMHMTSAAHIQTPAPLHYKFGSSTKARLKK